MLTETPWLIGLGVVSLLTAWIGVRSLKANKRTFGVVLAVMSVTALILFAFALYVRVGLFRDLKGVNLIPPWN
jgi:hypothetical protein